MSPKLFFPQDHQYQIRVYIEDTDYGKVVYHPNYLKFAERARTEMLRQCGIQQSTLLVDHGIMFVISQCHITYRHPARLDDILIIKTHLKKASGVRLSFDQTIIREQRIIAQVNIDVVAIDTQGKPTRFPKYFVFK